MDFETVNTPLEVEGGSCEDELMANGEWWGDQCSWEKKARRLPSLKISPLLTCSFFVSLGDLLYLLFIGYWHGCRYR